MDVGGVMETGGSGGLGGAGYKRGGWIPRMRTMWITGSRTRVLEPGVRGEVCEAEKCCEKEGKKKGKQKRKLISSCEKKTNEMEKNLI